MADVRREVLDAARQLFDDQAGTATFRRGRRTVMTGERIAKARQLYAAGTHTVDEIAHATGVSRATLYRHLKEVVSGDQHSETV